MREEQMKRKSEIVVVEGKAYHLGVAAHQMAPRIFQVGDPARAYQVAKRFDRVDHEVTSREFVTLTGTLKGQPATVMGTGIGTDNVEIALLEAYTLLAFDLEEQTRKEEVEPVTLIRIGTSGGVQADVEPGTMGITSYALGLDTTGIYFDVPLPDDTAGALEEQASRLLNGAMVADCRFSGAVHPYASRAAPEVVERLEYACAATSFQHVTGATVSAPGFYGASGRYLEGLRCSIPGIKEVTASIDVDGLRAINFEMESSLIFLLAQALGWRAGTICPIISNPARHDAVLDYKPYVEAAIDMAVETMISLTSS